MSDINILILCTGNSARSILGEALVSSLDGFRGYSAGSSPRGEPHPMALQVLAKMGHETGEFSSKSWDVYAGQGAPEMHAVITVCDNAAGEPCPVWPGHPVQVHWGLPDPASVEEMAFQRAAFEETYSALRRRMAQLPDAPWTGDPAALRAYLQSIHDG